jgi:hypothetical protein
MVEPHLAINMHVSIDVLPRYAQAYWDKFDPRYPILHRPSFNMSNASASLVAAIIVIGMSMSADQDVYQLALQLNKHLRALIMLHDMHETPTPLQPLQALVLTGLAGWVMDREQREMSHTFNSFEVTVGL